MGQNGMTVIFAVTSGWLGYENLLPLISPSALGILSADSSNIISLIQEEYNKIENRVELEQTPVTDEVRVKYFSNCDGDSYEETLICESLPANGIVSFIIEFDLEKCPADPKDWYQTLRVNPVGLPIFFDIALDLLCKEG
jgi:protocadherin alpha